jgi:hypothetical protein
VNGFTAAPLLPVNRMSLRGKSIPGYRFILPDENHDAWLCGEAGKEVLVPYPADRMEAWPVSSRVNSPKIMTLKSSCRSSLNPWSDRKISRNCFDAFGRGGLKFWSLEERQPHVVPRYNPDHTLAWWFRPCPSSNRGAAKDGGTLEYVFEAGEHNSPNAVTKEKAAKIAADFMTTLYHVQVGALETQEFRRVQFHSGSFVSETWSRVHCGNVRLIPVAKRIQVKLLKPDVALPLTWWSASFPSSKQPVVGNQHDEPPKV